MAAISFNIARGNIVSMSPALSESLPASFVGSPEAEPAPLGCPQAAEAEADAEGLQGQADDDLVEQEPVVGVPERNDMVCASK